MRKGENKGVRKRVGNGEGKGVRRVCKGMGERKRDWGREGND